jgi:nitroreductase
MPATPAEPAGLPLHPLLAARRSTHAFDPSTEVTSQELATLLEAARWAPSNRNSQPWRFVVGRRDDETHKKVFTTLAEADQRWAGHAPLLLVGAFLTRSENGGELRHAAYDLGQAVAHLTFQATALGLHVHQLAGFDVPALHTELGLPDGIWPKVVVVVGRLGDPAALPADLRDREAAPRVRHHLGTLLLG